MEHPTPSTPYSVNFKTLYIAIRSCSSSDGCLIRKDSKKRNISTKMACQIPHSFGCCKIVQLLRAVFGEGGTVALPHLWPMILI